MNEKEEFLVNATGTIIKAVDESSDIKEVLEIVVSMDFSE
jgi:hypothetical protein